MNRSCNTHELKILPRWFEDVQAGRKNFEIRRNDRDFKEGDYLLLKEWNKGKYTGREITKKIQYIYQGDGTYGISKDFCILGLYSNDKTQYGNCDYCKHHNKDSTEYPCCVCGNHELYYREMWEAAENEDT